MEMLLIFTILYFIPSIVVKIRSPHRYAGPVYIINIFAGWSGIGWVVALALAAARPTSTIVYEIPPPAPTTPRGA